MPIIHMQPLERLPDAPLADVGPISWHLLHLEIESFRVACRWVQHLPCRLSRREDVLRLFGDGEGTCHAKHSTIARLAAEIGLPVELRLGLYRLDDSMFNGVGELLRAHGLNYLPQLHFFLECEGLYFDLTQNDRTSNIEQFDHICSVSPTLTSAESEQCYRTYLEQYLVFEPALRRLGSAAVLALREQVDDRTRWGDLHPLPQVVNNAGATNNAG